MASVPRRRLRIDRPVVTIPLVGLAGLGLGSLARIADSSQWSREITSYLGLWWAFIVSSSIMVVSQHGDRSTRPRSARVTAAVFSSTVALVAALATYYVNSSVAAQTIAFWVFIAFVVAPVIAMAAAMFWIRPNRVWSPPVAAALAAVPLAEAFSIATRSDSSSRWGAFWFDVLVGVMLLLVVLAHTRSKLRTMMVVVVVVALGPVVFDLYAEVYRRVGSF